MAFTTQAGVLAKMPGHRADVVKTSIGGTGNVPWSYWGTAGWPAAGADPSSGLGGDIPTSATTGAIPFNDAGAGNALYLARATGMITTGAIAAGATIFVYDRLWHNSGIDRTATTGQTINSTTLTRPDSTGTDVEAWWQVYVTMGTGTPTVTLTYTNSSGTASRSGSSDVFTASLVAGRTGIFQLASGDTGVRSIQTWTGSVTFGTSGTIGLVLRRRLAMIPTATMRTSGPGAVFDNVACGLTKIPNGACLEIVLMASTSTALGVNASLNFAEG